MIEILKKFIAMLLCFITIISVFPMQIFAWTSTEGEKASSREGEDYVGYDGDKYYYLKTLTHVLYDSNGDVESHYVFTRTRPLDKYYLKHDGKEVEAFCIEAGVSFNESEDGYVSKSYRNSKYFENLPSFVKDGISTALVYGWTNKVPSELSKQCNLDDFRLATQLIIWEYQQQIRTSPTKIVSKNGVDADTFFHAIKNRPAEKAYNYILNKMSNHNIIPSFCNKSYDNAKEYTLKYNNTSDDFSLTLTDTNNTLVDIKTDNEDFNVVRSGNKYTFTSKKRNAKFTTIMLQKDLSKMSEAMLVWGKGGSQTMCTGCSDQLEFYLKLNTETYGTLELRKNSEDGKIANITFYITGNNQRTRYTATDYSGLLKVIDLLPGTYTITEVPVDKYITQQSRTFTIESGKTVSLSWTNKLKKFRVRVKKYDFEKNSVQGDASLKGAVYGLYNNDQLIKEYTTDDTGEFVTDYNVCGDGWYLKELVPPEGYVLDDTKYDIDARCEQFNEEYNEMKCDVKDKVIKGKISIVKHTDNGETKIETPENGAKFQVYLKSSKNYENAKEFERDLIICDEDGWAETKELPFGKYIVHQIWGWDDCERINDFEVEISKNNRIHKFLINNHKFESYVKFIKIDADSGKKITLSGATFSLYKFNNKLNEWEEVKCKVGNKYFSKWITGDDGIACTETKLSSGTYKIKEIEAPYGFIKNDEEIIFDVSMSNPTLEYDEDWDAYITVDVQNKKPKADLIINKYVINRKDVDKSVISKLDFSKVKFRLTAKDDIIDFVDGSVLYKADEEIGIYNLEKSGKLCISNLNLGEYYLEEIETAPGLLLDSSKYEVLFDYENDRKGVYTKFLNIENKSTLVEISKTDITGENEIEGAELMVTDKYGNVLDKWISTKNSHKIEGLIGGEKYILTEINAPDGYKIANSIEFVVDKNFDTQKIIMKDDFCNLEKDGEKEYKENKVKKEIYTGNNLSEFMFFDIIISVFAGIGYSLLTFKRKM